VEVDGDGARGTILLENPVSSEPSVYQTMLDWNHFG